MLFGCSTNIKLIKRKGYESRSLDHEQKYYGYQGYEIDGKKVIALPNNYLAKIGIGKIELRKGLSCHKFDAKINTILIKFVESKWLIENNLCHYVVISFREVQYIEDPHGHSYFESPYYNVVIKNASRSELKEFLLKQK